MDTFKNRFPNRKEVFYTFAVSIFIVHVWSIINVLEYLPAWVIRLSAWELIGGVAYTQVYALFESALVLGTLVLLGAFLPKRLFRDKFVPQSTMILMITSAWFILAHLNAESIRLWGLRQFIPWLALCGFTALLGILLIAKFSRLTTIITAILDRLVVLSLIYLFVDFLSIFVIVVRNL